MEGRFYSCLIDTDRYLLTCMRYIEFNPVRVGMVTDAAACTWSSYRSNALGQVSAMLKPHAVYLAPATPCRSAVPRNEACSRCRMIWKRRTRCACHAAARRMGFCGLSAADSGCTGPKSRPVHRQTSPYTA
jgi:hypothetical protein